jgi:PAS domain S-box-containing protein
MTQDLATANGLPRVIRAARLLEEEIAHGDAQAVIATDVAGSICYWNDAAERLYGWSADEVIGRNVTDVTPAESVRTSADSILRALVAGHSYRGAFMVRRRDGTPFIATVVDTPVRGDAGELVGVVGVSWIEAAAGS